MSDGTGPSTGARSALAAALLSVDPMGLGGAVLRAGPSPWREHWLQRLRQLMPPGTPWLRLPPNVSADALIGGLDLGATLQSGRPVGQSGLIARANNGCLLLPMAERLAPWVGSQLCAAQDQEEVQLQRDGLALRHPARLCFLALDEGVGDEEQPPAALRERLAFHLSGEANGADTELPWNADTVVLARARLPQVRLPEAVLQGLCAAAQAWGIDSLRAPIMALRAARALAALSGCAEVSDEHARVAAALVLAPRATRLPTTDAPADTPEPAPPPRVDTPPDAHTPDRSAPPDGPASEPTEAPAPDAPADPAALDDRLVDAVRAAIPAGLLAAMAGGLATPQRASATGTSGALLRNGHRGRPVGSRRGEPRSGVRLHVLDTLRAAAPWQRLRQGRSGQGGRIQIRKEDFHVLHHQQRRPTTTVFVVDASGSAALHRLAEAKGAVELLLAECYVRRDRVAVLAFRGPGCELLLPPTRSLARAKRSLSALPGGGGTPLAAGIEAATELGNQLVRQGDTPTLVLLTDGRANIALGGAPGRAGATADALVAAQRCRDAGLRALLIDTSPQPSELAHTLAQAMGASYLPMPHAGAERLSQAVQLAARPSL